MISSSNMMFILLHFFISLLLSCFVDLRSVAQLLPLEEVQTLKTISMKLNNQHWNLSQSSCGGGFNVTYDTSRTLNGGKKVPPRILSSVICDCSFSDNSVCHVTHIQLKGLNMTGQLPAEFSKLSFLQELDLTQNYIRGTIPRTFGLLRLKILSLTDNLISGSIPQEIANIATLEHLIMEDNQLGGTLPRELGSLSSLRRLLLSANNFTGTIPETFGDLKNLLDFRIDGSGLSGNIPDFIGNWTNITILNLQGTSMEGPIPSSISLLKNLEELRISDLHGSGTNFPDLRDMKNIKYLILRKCLIRGSIPEYIANMSGSQSLFFVVFSRWNTTTTTATMKRELAFALESQSQLSESLGRTRSSKSTPNDLLHNVSQMNGSIDQSPEIRVSISKCSALNVYQRNKRLRTSTENGDSVIVEEPKGDSEAPVGVSGKKHVLQSVEVPRRFTRSALKEPVGENIETKLVKEEELVLKADGNENELEFKVLKQIQLNKRPTTVKELLETGLLEDYPVFYNGCEKKEFTLRGAIKDTGILCYCSLCKGSRVVPPSTFEIHACKAYKRAAQYICLENGKSLLEVVKACNKYSLGTLATNIQSIIGPFTTKEPITCQNCKGSFHLTHAGNVGQICDSCIDSLKLQANPTKPTEVEARSVSPVVVFNSATSAKVCTSSRISKRNLCRKSSELDLASLSPRRASVRVLSRENSQKYLTKKSSRSVLVPESPESASVHNLSQSKSKGKVSKKMVLVPKSPRQTNESKGKLSKNMASVPKSPQSAPVQNKSQRKVSKKLSKSVPFQSNSNTVSSSRWKITKKDQKMHKLVFEKGGLPNGTEVAYFSRGKKLLEGYKMGAGIFCHCCNSEISPSQFEAHAGWASRKKPYSYIYISNGVSLHEFALSLLLDRNKNSAKDNDDLCIICADGGNLLLCDGCPRSFHKECASLQTVPRGKWYCKFCQNMFQREKFVEYNANAIAAGRVSGVDLIGQITERCIRIVKNAEEAEVIACVLCRGYDFSKTGFGPRTVILCDQCEKEYHVGCLKKHKMADLKELPKGKWFCCLDCKRIYLALQNLLVSEAEKLPDSLLDITRKKQKDRGLEGVTDMDVRWRLLSAKISSRENRLLLSEAVAIFHDCFDPIVDSVSGRDFIPSMVYGRNIRGQDFGGMYCAILTVNSSVVSAGLLRVFGPDIAELPLVATTKGNQGKGYFQLLFSCIEKLLAFLNVRRFVLPAAEEAESLWIKKFGFGKIPSEQLNNYRKRCWQMLTFKGTSMLEKAVPQCQITCQDAAVIDVSVEYQDAAVDVSVEDQDTDVDVSVKGQEANVVDVSVDHQVDEDMNVGDVSVEAQDDAVMVDMSVLEQEAAVVDVSVLEQDAAVVDASVEDQAK